MKTTITNLDTLVANSIDDIVTNNVNVVAAVDAVNAATTKASEASGYAVDAEASAVEAELSAQEAVIARDASAANVAEAAEKVVLAEIEANKAADSASFAEDSMLEAEAHRDTCIDVLAAARVVYDQFDDRYLGAHGTPPIYDNDGDVIQEGAMYWDMVDKALMIKPSTTAPWQAVAESSGALLAASNLADLLDTNEARSNLNVYAKGETNSIAQLDARDTANRDTDNHTDGTVNGVYTLDERTKLAGIEAGATADQVASEVPVTPNGNLSSNTVQLGLEELQSKIDSLTTVVEW